MSSVEDFRHGNIIIDGVILGRTPLSELKKYPIGNSYPEDDYELLDGDALASGIMHAETIDRLLELSNQHSSELLYKEKDKVSCFCFYDWEKIPFMKEILGSNYSEKNKVVEDEMEIVNLVESNGFVRIDPIILNDKEISHRDVICFISNIPNYYGDYVELWYRRGEFTILVNRRREWTTYYDGVKHSIQ